MFPVAQYERRLAATKSLEESIRKLLTTVEKSEEVTDDQLLCLTTGCWPDVPWKRVWATEYWFL